MMNNLILVCVTFVGLVGLVVSKPIQSTNETDIDIDYIMHEIARQNEAEDAMNAEDDQMTREDVQSPEMADYNRASNFDKMLEQDNFDNNYTKRIEAAAKDMRDARTNNYDFQGREFTYNTLPNGMDYNTLEHIEDIKGPVFHENAELSHPVESEGFHEFII